MATVLLIAPTPRTEKIRLSRDATPKEILIHYSNKWGFTYTDELLTQFEKSIMEFSTEWWVEKCRPEEQIKHWVQWVCPTTAEQILDTRAAKCLQNRCAHYKIPYTQYDFNKFIEWATNPTSEFPGQIYDCYVEESLVAKYKYISLLSVPQCVDAFLAKYRKSV